MTAATTALALTLTGCGSDSIASGNVRITLVAADYGDDPGDSSKRYWNALAREFEAQNPGIEVDVTIHSWNVVDRKVHEMVESGNAPDMAQIGAYAQYAEDDKLYRADQLLSIPTQADFVGGLARAGEVHRVQYGLPFVSSTRVLVYNKMLFAKAGITEPPTTWEELQEKAEALKQAGVPVPYGLPFGPEEPQAETLNWTLSGGGGLLDHVDSYAFDSNENIKTFEWLRDELVGKGLTNPQPGKTNREQLNAAFGRGEVGMINSHPALMQQINARGVKYGTAPLPGKEGESKSSAGVADWMMAFKQNGHREQVGKFLNFVFQQNNVLRFCHQYDLLPTTTSASEAMRADKRYTHLWEFLDQLPTAQFYPQNKLSWGPVVAQLKTTIGTAVEDGGDPEGVLSALQREAQAEQTAHRNEEH
ncbi:extracellular solute-binding protein [Streptomyces sp. KR80]|uniref:extracellular solute-binding protein n=1 Tax=Streptomyces sp. KR80 TaxID=3457426 RepID=UPI003FD50E51